MRAPLRWRYVALGAGFLGLAAVRAVQGAPLWAAVFVLAAAANAWLAVHEAPREAPAAAGHVATSEVERSLAGHRTSVRQWQVLAAAGVLVGAGLLMLEPGLSVFAAGAALFALHRARRSGHAVATLQRLRVEGG